MNVELPAPAVDATRQSGHEAMEVIARTGSGTAEQIEFRRQNNARHDSGLGSSTQSQLEVEGALNAMSSGAQSRALNGRDSGVVDGTLSQLTEGNNEVVNLRQNGGVNRSQRPQAVFSYDSLDRFSPVPAGDPSQARDDYDSSEPGSPNQLWISDSQSVRDASSSSSRGSSSSSSSSGSRSP